MGGDSLGLRGFSPSGYRARWTVGLCLLATLATGLVFRIDQLDDAGRREALRVRAEERGFEFPDDVASFVLSRYPRDMHSLFSLFDRLEHSMWAAKRRLTIPFVKALLDDR